MLAYLDILQPTLNGTRIGPGYILINLDDILQPVYQHFLGAMTFLWEGMQFIAFVTCKCSFVVWALKDTYEIHEQSEACECLADMLLEMYATRFGGTAYGEGVIVTPGATPEAAPSTEAHGSAIVFRADGKDYIATRSCDPEDCTTFGIRELIAGEYYREMPGVCDCPELANFIMSAEFAGHEVFGESILFRVNPGTNSLNFQYIQVKACYIDAENAEWIYAECDGCAFGTAPLSYNRADFSCGGCVDVRKLPFPGFVAEQYGSHTCYSYTLNGAKVLRIVYTGTTVGIDNGGGYVDFRTLIRLYDVGDKRYLAEFWNTDDPDDPIDIESYEVPKDTVLDGYANLLSYPVGEIGNYTAYGIPGDTYSVQVGQWAPGRGFDTEAEAVAYSNTYSTAPLHGGALFNYYQFDLESTDKRSADCSALIDIHSEVYYDPQATKPWTAWPIRKGGVVYSLRALRTNRGFLMLDGTYLDSLYIPTLAEVKACADYIQWQWEHSHWNEGETLVIDEAGKEDNVCKEIDPEEFE